MSYYLEVWLRGFAKDHIRTLSTKDSKKYHPHITLVRPFNILSSEDTVKNKVIDFCNGKRLIRFCLSGEGHFNNHFFYIPVVEEKGLLEFNNGLEKAICNDVKFSEKLAEGKKLHVTVDVDRNISPSVYIEQFFLRLTALKEKKIWFSYDFVRQSFLNREESLDKKLWIETVDGATRLTGYKPTRNGFVNIVEPKT